MNPALLSVATVLAMPPTVRAMEDAVLDATQTNSIVLSRNGDGEVSAREEPAAELSRAATLAAEKARTEADLQRISNEITLSKETAARIDQEVSALQADRERIRVASIAAAAEQKRLSGEITRSEDRIGTLGQDEASIRVSLRERRGVLAEVLAALQRMGRKPPPALLVKPDDALGSVRSAILLGSVVPEIRAQTDGLRDDLQKLEIVKRELVEEKARFAEALAKGREEAERLTRLFTEKEKLEAEGRGRIGEENRRATELAARATTLQDLIASLEAQSERARAEEEQRQRLATETARKAAEEAEAKAEADETSPPPATTPEGLSPAANPTGQYDIAALRREMTRMAPTAPFSTLKRSLVQPVAGRETGRFGRDNGTGRPASGVVFAARAGDVVTSPSDAEVLYSGPFRSYGQLLILNAGDGYHVVLAGMSRIDVSVGQFVLAGEPLAVMGATRIASAAKTDMSSAEPSLYVEFRKDGKPVDPTPWWADGSSGRTRNDT